MTTGRQVARDAARSPLAGGSSTVVDLSSNDYLGLRNDPRVRAAAIRGIERYGVGSGGAREVAVGMGVVRELEERLARYKGVATVRMVQSGYAANLDVMPALAGPGDVAGPRRPGPPPRAPPARPPGAPLRRALHPPTRPPA